MTEILTESFCERCGTRYTFEAVAPKKGVGSIGTFGRGLRHFLTDPGSTLGESFAVARSETEQRATAHALEAFHRTFNFCLSCRQYVCGECWNAVEGRCLTCTPVAEPEPLVASAASTVLAPLPPIAAHAAPVADLAPPRIQVEPGSTAEEEAALAARLQALAEPDVAAWPVPTEEEEAAEEAAPAEAAAEEAAPEEAATKAAALELDALEAEMIAERLRAQVEPAAEIEPLLEPGLEVVAEREVLEVPEGERPVEAASLQFEPGRSLDAEIAAYEEWQAKVEPEAEEPEVAAAEPEVAEPEAEPIAAAEPEVAEPAAEPIAAAEPEVAEPEPVAAVTPQPAPAPPAAPEPAAPIPVRPPIEPVRAPAPAPAPAERIAAVHAPSPPATPEPQVSAVPSPLEFLPPLIGSRRVDLGQQRPAPVVHGARTCPSCGLSLSVSARFCRRCGTAQQQAG